MSINATSIAAGVGVTADNVQFATTAEVLTRKILIIGTYDPAITTVTNDVPSQVFSAEDAGSKYGFGFMLHRLAKQAFAGSNGVETWVVPQAEVAGAKAAGDITFTATSASAGTIYLYVSGIQVPVTVAAGDNGNAIATKVVAALDAVRSEVGLPTTQAVNGVTLNQVDITAKTTGTFGNDISLTFNWGLDEALPAGVSVSVTPMSGGTGTPDIDSALNGLGTGDGQNEKYFTDVVHGYLQDTSTLDKLSVYNGSGDTETGNYSNTVARPFRVLTGDVVADAAGLSALITLGNGRKSDRTNGVVAAPGSPNHPSEVAAVAIGVMAKTNSNRAEENYVDKILPGIIPGDISDRWTNNYNDRDSAVKAGISPTDAKSGALTLQNVMSFYHPDDVPRSSNGYASMRNISITQNILYNTGLTFSADKWKNISIVSDSAKVTNITSRQKVRDIDSVEDEIISLADSWAGNAWLYSADYTKDRVADGGLVSIRASSTGFDTIIPVIYSVEGGIINTTVQFDTSIAVTL